MVGEYGHRGNVSGSGSVSAAVPESESESGFASASAPAFVPVSHMFRGSVEAQK